MSYIFTYAPLIAATIALFFVAWASVSGNDKACSRFKEVYYQMMTVAMLVTVIIQWLWVIDTPDIGDRLDKTWALSETTIYALITVEAYFHIKYKCCSFCKKLKDLKRGVITK
jgi:hypothetical protein